MPEITKLRTSELLQEVSTIELAQTLAQRLGIKPEEWHRLKGDRQAQASQQIAASLVFLLKKQPEEALVRLKQAQGWLDHTLSIPKCPTHHK